MRSLVEPLEILLRHVAVANAIEDAQECFLALAVYLIQLKQRNSGAFVQRRHLKEKWPTELAIEVLGDIALDHRRQLMQIAEQ